MPRTEGRRICSAPRGEPFALPVLLLRAAVSGHRGNDVTDPPEQAAAANPEARSDDQPEDPSQKVAVVELTNARNERAPYGRDAGVLDIGHAFSFRLSGLGARDSGLGEPRIFRS